MTQERIISFDLADLTEYELICNRCGKGVAFPMASGYLPSSRCPHCDESLAGCGWDEVRAILRSIRVVIRDERPVLRIRFRIKESDRPTIYKQN